MTEDALSSANSDLESLGDDLLGDDRQKALADVFQRERPRLARLIQNRLDRRLNGRLDASDIVQQTYLSAAKTLDTYVESPSVPIFVWIRSIAFGVIAEAARFHLQTLKRSVDRERNGVQSDSTNAILVNELSASMMSPASVLVQGEMLDQIQACIELLSPPDREILTLIHVEMLSTTEAAAELKVEPATVRQRHFRAIRRLRNKMESFNDELG